MKFKLPDQIEKFKSYVDKFSDHTGIVELTKKFKPRSSHQNKYLHVVISLFAIETGYTIDEMKIVLKSNCHFMTYKKNNVIFMKKSSTLDTKQLSEWIEWIRNKASNQGIYIPSAEDYHRDWGMIEQEIEAKKIYL